MTTQTNTNVLKTLQNPYVGILRQKIGEFMLIHNDLFLCISIICSSSWNGLK